MLSMREERRHLVYEVLRHLRKGESQRGIARTLGIAPKTIRAMQRDQQERREQGESSIEREVHPPRTPRRSKLDRYADQIKLWLEKYPDITAQRLLERLQEVGFDGQYTVVRLHLRQLRKALGMAKKKAVVVVRTAPGQQSQFDWSPYEIAGSVPVQVWGHSLSWSRARSFLSSDNQRQPAIFNGLKGGFELWKGVPGECVTDSMPGVVDRWEAGRPILNVRFVDFAAYYAFSVVISPRRFPRFKGKTERPFWFVELNFLNARTFHSPEQFAEELARWQEHKAMEMEHPETGRPIREMLELERPHLHPLPPKPYDTRDIVSRVVDAYAYASFETNFYPVPEQHVGDVVYLCVGPDSVEIFDLGVHRVAVHQRMPAGAGIRPDNPWVGKRGRYDIERLIANLSAWGPAAEAFALQVRERKRYAGSELSHLLGLRAQWSADDILGAVTHAAKYQAYEVKAVERILVARYTPRRLAEQIADASRRQIQDRMHDHPVRQRGIDTYDVLRTGDAALVGEHASPAATLNSETTPR
jgi:transposase